MTKETAKTKANGRNIYVIDAKGQVMGRLATRVATLLRGKNKAEFVPYRDRGAQVTVFNLGKIRVTGKKKSQKIYWRHTGYLGNTKFETLGRGLEKDPRKVFQKVVLGMLPKNKLRAKVIKKLKLYEGEIA